MTTAHKTYNERQALGVYSAPISAFMPIERLSRLTIKKVGTIVDWRDYLSIFATCFPGSVFAASRWTAHLVGYLDGSPVAIISYKHNRIRGLVSMLGVIPMFQGLGFGHDMSARAVADIRSAGCTRIHASLTHASMGVVDSLGATTYVKGLYHG